MDENDQSSDVQYQDINPKKAERNGEISCVAISLIDIGLP
jgi:hypothetical protein